MFYRFKSWVFYRFGISNPKLLWDSKSWVFYHFKSWVFIVLGFQIPNCFGISNHECFIVSNHECFIVSNHECFIVHSPHLGDTSQQLVWTGGGWPYRLLPHPAACLSSTGWSWRQTTTPRGTPRCAGCSWSRCSWTPPCPPVAPCVSSWSGSPAAPGTSWGPALRREMRIQNSWEFNSKFLDDLQIALNSLKIFNLIIQYNNLLNFVFLKAQANMELCKYKHGVLPSIWGQIFKHF